MSWRAERSNLKRATWEKRQESANRNNVMRFIERFIVMVAFLIPGVLIVLSVGRPLGQLTLPPAVGSHGGKDTPVVRAIRDTSQKKPASSFVANPFCEACHADFAEEELVVDHLAFDIGCERCHGESYRHRSDEANVTPPEIMYPKEKINPTCMTCHPRHDIRDTKDHQPLLAASQSVSEPPPSGGNGKKYCTDCHGSQHHMKKRTIRWDKCTGALLQKSN